LPPSRLLALPPSRPARPHPPRLVPESANRLPGLPYRGCVRHASAEAPMGFTVLALTLLQAQSAVALRAPEAVAVATPSTAPRIDGRLDDAVWARATPTGSFRQREPDEG